MIPAVVIALSESAEAEGHSATTAYLIGAITLAIFIALVAGLAAFGGGREHS